MLIQYVRNKHGIPKGVVVALEKDKIGWSLCMKKDKYDRKLGLEIAKNRAEKQVNLGLAAHSCKRLIRKMEERVKKYYRD